MLCLESGLCLMLNLADASAPLISFALAQVSLDCISLCLVIDSVAGLILKSAEPDSMQFRTVC